MAKKAAKPKRGAKKTTIRPANRKPAAKSSSKPAGNQAGDAHLATLKGLYKRWSETKGANFEEIMALLADDAVWRSIANGLHGLSFAREPLNKGNVRTYFENLFKDWELVFFDVERMVAQANTVVVISEASFRHRRTGKSFMSPKVDVWDFKRGKVVGFFEYFDTASAIRSAL
ncbi:MAG: nuclear transport factor 2 family protein [Pseudomonadota bacterium]|nr:nuclear transport factor 2 family protein [Pseudomonadota bacterium]